MDSLLTGRQPHLSCRSHPDGRGIRVHIWPIRSGITGRAGSLISRNGCWNSRSAVRV